MKAVIAQIAMLVWKKTRSIFGLGQQHEFSTEIGNNTDDVDTSGLDQNIINTLEDTFVRIDLDTEASVEG